MYKCKICDQEFELLATRHYVARDAGKSGLAAFAGGPEETLYDAFDCPFCGCQNVTQERKRVFSASNRYEEVFSDDKDKEEIPECFGGEGDMDCLDCDKSNECLAEYKKHNVVSDTADKEITREVAGKRLSVAILAEHAKCFGKHGTLSNCLSCTDKVACELASEE